MDGLRFDLWTRRHFGRWAAGSVAALTGLAERETEARKKRKKKKKKTPSGCSRSCFNKVCGQDDGCGDRCTVPAGCASTAACIDGQCAPDICPTCTGNHVCHANGSCTCPPGLKECGAVGYFGNCHECCGRNGTFPDPDCEASPNGDLCPDHDEGFVYRCGCLKPGGCEQNGNCQVNCNGTCGECCENDDCLRKHGDENRVCNASLGCECKAGTEECDGSRLCRDQTDARTCGVICRNCPSGFSCENGDCCIGLANECISGSQLCCSGLACTANQQGTGFVCG